VLHTPPISFFSTSSPEKYWARSTHHFHLYFVKIVFRVCCLVVLLA
jgi:hypothetical protein